MLQPWSAWLKKLNDFKHLEAPTRRVGTVFAIAQAVPLYKYTPMNPFVDNSVDNLWISRYNLWITFRQAKKHNDSRHLHPDLSTSSDLLYNQRTATHQG